MEGNLPLAGIRVFVVEDEALVLLSLLDMLEDMGCTVPASAQGVDDALHKASDLSFDIALLDVSVGGQRVDPVADLLAGRNVPFVFTSGHERDSLPMRFKERPLLSKPYAAGQLQAALLRGLAHSEPDRPRAA
jgi:CheY-like chemotaxis protein